MAAEYLLDVLGDKPMLALPTQHRAPQRTAAVAAAALAVAETTVRDRSVPSKSEPANDSNRRLLMRAAAEREKNTALPGDMRRRLASVLAREFSKKVDSTSTALQVSTYNSGR